MYVLNIFHTIRWNVCTNTDMIYINSILKYFMKSGFKSIFFFFSLWKVASMRKQGRLLLDHTNPSLPFYGEVGCVSFWKNNRRSIDGKNLSLDLE